MKKAYLLVLLLTGCATQEQIAAQRRYEFQQQQAAQEAYRQSVFSRCRAYGFTDGTAEFRNCLMQVDQANQQQNAQMQGIVLQQLLQQQYQSMPRCASLPPGMAGYRAAEGTCRP